MNKWKLKFPHSSTPVMKKMMFFHEKCLLMVIFVLTIVLTILIYNLFKLKSSMKNLEKTKFEILWTVIPTFMIISLMMPSLELLYFTEESGGVFFKKKMKIIGHQWYWTYKKKNFVKEYDSYIMKSKELNLGEFRKCEVDRPLKFEVKLPTRLLITSADSIHSWAVPELGVKVDAIPGRLNQVIVFPLEVGRFFGFCSELCGVNHSFMPIVVEVLNLNG